jgi:hypothetical protein
MYLLLCKPIVVVPQNILSARECRVVQVRPTQSENKVEVEVLDAPPINIQDKVYAEARICDPSLDPSGKCVLPNDGSISSN